MKKQSPIQQELLRRRSSKNIPYPPLHQTATPHVPSPAVPQNGLRRRSSISPAARDFVPLSASSYGSALNRKKALIIGIGYADHKHLAPVPGARNDVRDMFYLLTGELFGFQESDVSVLCDELDQIGSVAASAPTRINILREMKCLTEGIKAGDSVVFFFAGHGEAVEDTSGDEIETGVDQCIMPIDYRRKPGHNQGLSHFKGVEPILDDTIYERLVRSVPDGAKVTAIIDACKSGTVCDLPVIYDANGKPRYRNGESRPPREALRPYLPAGGCVLFSGSADHQMSADMPVIVESEGHAPAVESSGIMTRSFIDAVREMCQERNVPYDGVEPWSYGQLLSRVKELVKERAMMHLPDFFEKQEPQLSTSHAIDIWDTSFTL